MQIRNGVDTARFAPRVGARTEPLAGRFGDDAIVGGVDADGEYLKVTLVDGGRTFGYTQPATAPDCGKLTPVDLNQTPDES